MLRLKRASAGSGKTYELAKTFIKLLLSSKKQGHKRQLRNPNSLRESLSGIMAVTFTVKATAEMKQRIVEKLAALSVSDRLEESEAFKKTDYLRELTSDLNTNRFEIADLSRRALQTLLLHYSDFRVQTIDSFFQGILHTFTYEANIDDSFNMEIDTEYVSSVGLDSALDELSEAETEPERGENMLPWLRQLMLSSVGDKNWNVFTRQDGSRYLYSDLIKEVKNLEREEFQHIREELAGYFHQLGDVPFIEIVKEVDDANLAVWRELHENAARKASELKGLLESVGLTEKDLCKRQGSKLILSMQPFNENVMKFPETPVAVSSGEWGYSLGKNSIKTLQSAIKINPTLNASIFHEIDGAFVAWLEAYNHYLEEYEKHKTDLLTWLEYRKMLPKLMMVLEIARRKEDYLKKSNSLQISDTNGILAGIIDGSDTPFVYERMGSRLNHYLIDEFQDTSRMQWENLLPLLRNSDSEGHDNLIIGDAKQSIYRFRNADYRLIMEVGEKYKFSKVVNYTGETEPADASKENTNYRSCPNIVNMNNFIFSTIVNITNDSSGNVPLFNPTIRGIYQDCVQALPDKEGDGEQRKSGRTGYVEFLFAPSSGKEENQISEAENSTTTHPGFRDLPARIKELVGRGYKFRDIGVLVQSHKDGMSAVNAINEYNDLQENEKDVIPIISEENLLVASAVSVKLVVYALEMAAAGKRDGLEKNPQLEEPVDEAELFEMIFSLNSKSLPSLVEAILERFVPSSRRNKEAPFIAAFQDAVLDYSSTHTSDIGTFLKWWKLKSKNLSITSPEDSDGVILQTIHKAKGLEYKVVIIPNGDFLFMPSNKKSEWRWVEPAECVKKRDLLPKHLPVSTGPKLEETAHKNIRERYCEEFALDELNKMYVAFTRPVEELFVYMPVNRTSGNMKGGNILRDMFRKEFETPASLSISEFSLTEEEDEKTLVRYGTPTKREAIEARRLKEMRKTATEPIIWETYSTHSDRSVLVFQEDHRLLKHPLHVDPDEDELDPRAEGTLKHRIMQLVETPEDLDKALAEMKVWGLVDADKIRQWGAELRDAIESVSERGWFGKGKRVINERPVLQRGKENYRPDRIIIDNKKRATVIDYKFGDQEKKYRKQVNNYVSLLKASGKYSSVEGYIWYIPGNEIIKVG